MKTFTSSIVIAIIFTWHTSTMAEVKPAAVLPKEEIIYEEPYKRPLGFTINLGSLASFTLEGRFQLGLTRKLSLILSPSFQNTLKLPWYHLERGYTSFFDVRRLNLGAGLRWHFYDYDSRDGWFIEFPMARGGLTWVGTDESVWSFIPSTMFGYTAIYDMGYTVSFGMGLEYELLFGEEGYYTEHLHTAYYTFTKVPLMGELSVGWTW